MSNNKKISIGLDISDYTIEVVELSEQAGKIEILNFGRIKLESGIVQRGRIKDQNRLSKALKTVLDTAKPQAITNREVVAAIPASQVYTLIFDLEIQDKSEINKKLQNKIETTIPLESQDIIFSYKILRKKTDTKIKVLSFITSKQVINEWENFFNKNKLKVKLFDMEILASWRGLQKTLSAKPVCLIDIGATTTNLLIFNQFGLAYAYTMQYGGEYFTKKIAQGLKLEIKVAEKYKIDKGLIGNKKLAIILEKCLCHLSEEIERNINYFFEQTKENIKDIILLGGSSQMLGLLNQLKRLLRREDISLGKSILKIDEDLKYITAIGLASRELKNSSDDPYFYSQYALATKKKLLDKINYKINLENYKFFIPMLKIIKFIFIFLLISVLGLTVEYFIFKNQNQNQNIPVNPIIEKTIKEETTPVIEEAEIMIKIRDSVSSLNIRSGPSTNFSIIGKASGGEKYILIEEKEDWYKIKLDDKKEAWVFASFTEKLE